MDLGYMKGITKTGFILTKKYSTIKELLKSVGIEHEEMEVVQTPEFIKIYDLDGKLLREHENNFGVQGVELEIIDCEWKEEKDRNS